MTVNSSLQATLVVCVAMTTLTGLAAGQSPSRESLPRQALTGPSTEKRFPPLVVPSGFRSTLFACDPLVEYPSVIALGPRPGSVFVAHDYMTGLGTEIVRHDEIRLLEDTDGDGYADRSTVYAGGFNSIQGLASHAGTVFAMHAPFLTALRDTDGDGVADERRDLLSGLGLPPEKNEWRLHSANGVVVGHDGWLYLAVGDHGIDVVRPEGDRVILQGGGILRCRPDGRELHVFATGLRNIYDVALDDELNVFMRDNENDGGDYMIRVCRSFFGADHGYPYHYYERPDEALGPLADLGRGSSAGGVCYLETAFPAELRGNLFFCEWGRSIVRYECKRTGSGSGFAPMKEIEFATGGLADPYGFKPTDVIVDRDGSLLVSDWCDDQRPKRGRGRIYRIASVGPNGERSKVQGPRSSKSEGEKNTANAGRAASTNSEQILQQLDSPSYFARVSAQDALESAGPDGLRAIDQALATNNLGPLARLHAVWILAHLKRTEAVPNLLALAKSDADARVRAQSVRAIGDLCVNRTAQERSELAPKLAAQAANQDPRVALETVIALGRLRWSGTPDWLRDHLTDPDAPLSHAATQALRRCDNWPPVLRLLDEPDSRPIHRIALWALAERADPLIVDGLIDRLRREKNPRRRIEYADALTRVFKQPGPWTYWGYRPSPRPVNVATWERTEAIAAALDRALADSDRDVRVALLRRMQREAVPVRMATLCQWLDTERDAKRVAAILGDLANHPADETGKSIEEVVRNREYPLENRRTALSLLCGRLNGADEIRLLDLAQQVEDGPILVGLLGELARRPGINSRQFVLTQLDAANADVCAAALDAAAALRLGEAARRLARFLQSENVHLRSAAAAAAGALAAKDSVPFLLRMLRDDDPATRRASLESLRLLREPTAAAAAAAALEQPAALAAGIDYLAEFGTLAQADALAQAALTNRSLDVLTGVVRALSRIGQRLPRDSPDRGRLERLVSEIQGQSGLILCWHVWDRSQQRAVRTLFAAGPESRVDFDGAKCENAEGVLRIKSEFTIPRATRAQFLTSSSCPIEITLNGRAVFSRAQGETFRPDSDRFDVELPTGLNRIALRLPCGKQVTFHVHFRPFSSSLEQERLVQFALHHAGNSARGRDVFRNVEKSLCATCHRVGDLGNRIGPELTGLGGRFSRIHVIESILEPSRTIAPGYQSVAVVLGGGRQINGVKIGENETTLVLGDEKGQRHEIRKSDIEEQTPLAKSLMPDGLEKRLSDRDFVDLLAFLLSERRPERGGR